MEKVQKKKKILAKGKLCFGCYQPMTENYNAKGFKQRLIWRLCLEFFATGMHDYIKKTNEVHDNT